MPAPIDNAKEQLRRILESMAIDPAEREKCEGQINKLGTFSEADEEEGENPSETPVTG